MKTIKKLLLVLVITTCSISCSTDDSIDIVQRFDRNITYKIIGEYSGEIKITYANPDDANGVTPGETTTVLPWNKALKYKKKINLTALSVSGSNGIPNEVIQLQIFSNGELVETELAIANQEGKLYAETSIIYFK